MPVKSVQSLIDIHSIQTNVHGLTGQVGHSHLNKTLLDSYTQTEANLADAVYKKHLETHSIESHDTDATGTQLNELVGGGATILHSHSGGSDGEVHVVATQDTINSTTTLSNATGLNFNASANSVYIIEVFLIFCDEHHARSILIQAVNNTWPQYTIDSGKIFAVIDQGVDQGARRVSKSRMNDHPRGLVHDNDRWILMEDGKGEGFWFERKGLGFWKGS